MNREIVHDPLCVLFGDCSIGGGDHDYHREPPIQCSWCGEMCVCDAIAKARADEREKAGERIMAIPQSHLALSRGWIDRHEAWVAARGES